MKPQEVNMRKLSEKGQEIIAEGKLNSESRRYESGEFFDIHLFKAEAKSSLTIDLRSDDFPSYLILFDPNEEILSGDSCSGFNKNPRIIVDILVSGTYKLIVTSAESGETGSYSLSMHATNDLDCQWAKARRYEKEYSNLYQAGKYAEAIEAAQKTAEIEENILCKDNPNLARTLNNLAALYEKQECYKEAENLYLHIKQLRERVLPKDYPALSSTWSNLATFYYRQGRYEEAETLYLKIGNLKEKILPKDHPDLIVTWNHLAASYYGQGRYEKAETLYFKIGNLKEKILPKDHPDLASTWNNLASLYIYQGRYKEAESLFIQVKQLREKILPKDHPDLASTWNNLASLYIYQGRYKEAESLFIQVKQLREKILPKDHPDLATYWSNLACLYAMQGRYEEAENLHLKAQQLNERVLPQDHPDLAKSWGNLANLYEAQGRYEEAENLHLKAQQLNERVLPQDHPDLAKSWGNLANLYEAQGRYEEAENLYLKAQQLNERVLPKDHPDLSGTWSNLANLYKAQGRYGEAESLFIQVKQLNERVLPKDHPDRATIWVNLASLYEAQGRYEEAENLFTQAKQLEERVLHKHHPKLASTWNNLAQLYTNKGRYEEAENLYLKVRQLNEQILSKVNPVCAEAWNNLATLYKIQGRYDEAESLFIQAKQLNERVLPKHHPKLAMIWQNLAGLYIAQGRYEEAETFILKANQLNERILPQDHPGLARSWQGVAAVCEILGRHEEAEGFYLKAKQLNERILPQDHPDLATIWQNLSGLYITQGYYGDGLSCLQNSLEIEELNLSSNLISGSEQQKQEYVATLTSSTNMLHRLNFLTFPVEPTTTALALTTTLRRKGRILDVLNNSFRKVRENLTKSDKLLLENYIEINTQISNLTYQFSSKNRALLEELREKAKTLEVQLSKKSQAFQQKKQTVSWEAVQGILEEDTVLLEFVRYQALKLNKQSKARYGLYILKLHSLPVGIDLGEAEQIEKLIEEFREALSQNDSDVKPIAKRLYQKLIEPVQKHLTGFKHLLISPDSQLNLIPFGALISEKGEYLTKIFNINYITSGRDLLRLEQSPTTSNRPVIIANPDYNYAGSASSQKKLNTHTQEETPVMQHSQREKELKRLGYFKPLPGTAKEVHAILSLNKLDTPLVLTEQGATEEALIQHVVSPQILHIATHGFSLQGPGETRPISVHSSSRDLGEPFLTPKRQIRVPIENPLLRSGLALAGINVRKNGSEDGIFTALEAANLDLRGTQLVVLSACETGLGEVHDGEGVYGLRRAFVLAGAQSQLMSLWKISDDETPELMVRYYDKLLEGKGRAEALTETQREMLENYHPYYWAAFIPSGDWRPLSNIQSQLKGKETCPKEKGLEATESKLDKSSGIGDLAIKMVLAIAIALGAAKLVQQLILVLNTKQINEEEE